MARILVGSQTQFGASPICRMLSENKHQLTIPSSLENAFELMGGHDFDVILLDVGVLNKGMLERIIALRARGNTIPVVLVCDTSNLDTLGYVQLAAQIPAVTVITRPCYFPELLETIDASLSLPLPASAPEEESSHQKDQRSPASVLHP